jgi:hypothetical protein
MPSDTPRKGPQLKVIKSNNLENQGGYIALEAMTSQQSDSAKRMLQAGNISGLLAGIIKGDAAWDIRPVVVERGAMAVLRLIDPALQSSPKELNDFQNLNQELCESGQVIEVRRTGDSLWVRRPFVQTCLSHLKNAPDQPLVFLRELIEQVRSLHDKGLVHGHLSPSNVGIHSGGSIILLDAGFCAYSSSARAMRGDVAPELKAGFHPSTATDVYGVGVIMSMLMKYSGGKLSSLEPLVRALLSPDPVTRPALDWVLEKLSSGSSASINRKFESPTVHSSQQQSSSLFAWLRNNLITVGVAVGLIGTFGYFLLFKGASEEIPYEAYWLSGQPSYMNKVAVAAVRDDDFDAQAVIVSQALEGKEYPSVLNSIIKVAFDSRWERDLKDEDRVVALQVALGPLLPKSLQQFDISRVVHPAVILALVGSVNIASRGDQFSSIPVSHLSTLPQPFGEAFHELDQAKVPNMEHLAAKGLAHILLGDRSREAVAALLVEDPKIDSPEKRLRIIGPLLLNDEQLSTTVTNSIGKNHPLYRSIAGWYDQDELGVWQRMSEKDKLLIGLGLLPKILTLEQSAELLVFPDEGVRASAQSRIRQIWPEAPRSLLKVLTLEANKISATQSAGLLLALHVKPESQVTFLAKWFQTEPSLDMVVDLLINTKAEGSLESLHLEAARYLARHINELNLSLSQLGLLASHPEPLARALAYRKLRPSVPEERAILENSNTVEPSERMRQQIAERLKGAE